MEYTAAGPGSSSVSQGTREPFHTHYVTFAFAMHARVALLACTGEQPRRVREIISSMSLLHYASLPPGAGSRRRNSLMSRTATTLLPDTAHRPHVYTRAYNGFIRAASPSRWLAIVSFTAPRSFDPPSRDGLSCPTNDGCPSIHGQSTCFV